MGKFGSKRSNDPVPVSNTDLVWEKKTTANAGFDW